MNKQPKISIITVSFNAVNTIEETILSVINQTYSNIEYIIIDGGSTDGTVDIIKKYSNYISYWVSESDKGIYDAMNKGGKIATGEFIQFLNAGDWLVNKYIINDIFRNKNFEGVDVVYGDMIIRRNDGIFYAKPLDLCLFKIEFPLYHPSTFISKKKFEKHLFDISYKISADFKMLRDVYYEKSSFIYIPYAFTNFDGINGVSSSGNALKIYQERGRILGYDKQWTWTISCLSFVLRLRIKSIIKRFLYKLSPTLVNKIQSNRKPNNFEKIS